MELWLEGLQSDPAPLKYRHGLPLSDTGDLQGGMIGEKGVCTHPKIVSGFLLLCR